MSGEMKQLGRWFISNLLVCIMIAACLLNFVVYASTRATVAEERKAFQEATWGASVGRWYWDLKTDQLKWDDTMFRIFGKTPATWEPNYEGFASYVDERDRAEVRNRCEYAIKNSTSYQMVFRTRGDDGVTRYILAGGYAPLGSKGYMTGVCVPLSGKTFTDLYNVLPPILEP